MRFSVRKMAVTGLLGAVSIVMGLVPWLGFIPVPTPAGSATIMHVPAILAAVAEGPGSGLMVGFIFGLMSFLRATNPAFADPMVAILPRLFIGPAAYLVYRALRGSKLGLRLGVAGVVGSLVNTGLVLGMMGLKKFVPWNALGVVAVGHGIPEAIVAAIVVVTVGLALHRAGFLGRDDRSSRPLS